MNKLYLGSHSFLKEKLAEVLNKNKGKKISIVVYTNKQRLYLEEFLVRKLGIIYNIEFLTMMDLSKKITNIEPLQDFDKELVIKGILQQNHPEFEGLYSEFSSLIEIIKERDLNKENLNNDFIKKILDEYENFKGKEYFDREDVHKKVAEETPSLTIDVLIIYGLKDIGSIHRKVFEKVKKSVKDVYVLAPIFPNSGYYENYEFFKKEVEFFRELTGSKEEVEQTENENVKTGLYIYKFDYQNLPIDNQNITLINPKNELEELEFVANKIDDLIEKGIKFYEIGIVIPDISRYIPFLKEVFTKYKIPYYLSEQNRYIDEPLYKKLFSLFKIKLEDFSRESILGFLSPDILQLRNFEKNYNTILNSGIKRGFDDIEKLIFEKLEENLKNLLKSINEIPDKASINQYIETFLKINECIKDERLKVFLENILLTLKESALYQKLFKDEIKYENFVSIVETFFHQENKDNRIKGNTVFILSPTSAEGNNFKYLFILNLNSSSYPPSIDDNVLASSNDLDGFSNSYNVLMQSLANFSALLDKDKVIFVSSLKASVNASYLPPSVFFEELKRILNKQPESFKLNPKTLKDFRIQNAKKLADQLENLKLKKDYIKSLKNIKKENFKYEVELKQPISATKFKTYAYCPYKFFIDYVLGIKDEKEINRMEISSLEIGEMVHKILEDFYKSPFIFDNSYLSEKKQEIDKKFEEFFKEQSAYLIPSYLSFEKAKLEEYKENLVYFIEQDLKRLKDNNIKVEMVEKEYECEHEGIRFNARIDRVDKDESENYYIWDYKTDNGEIDIKKDIGNKYIQLLIYQKCLESDNKCVKKIGIIAINDKTGNIFCEIDLEKETLNEHLKNLVENLKNRYFYPQENNKDNICKSCSYKDFCLKDKLHGRR